MRSHALIFAERVQAWLDEEEIIREGLAYEAKQLISQLQDRGGFAAISLRKLAREVGLSASYLSRVVHGKEIISPRAYLRLCKLLVEKP